MRESRIPNPPPVPELPAVEPAAVRIAWAEAPEILTGWAKFRVRLKFKRTLFRVLRRCYRNPLDWVRGVYYLVRRRRSILGKHRIRKMVKANGLYYMDLYIPGWKDHAFERFVATELSRFKPHQQETNRINKVFLSITKKCAMQCEHCSAWDTLNMKDTLGVDQYQKLLEEIYRIGVSQVYFTGGEPLLKPELLESLISQMPGHVKSWVATSGYQLTREKAKRLKKAGLTGVFVSLDHYEEERHNAFRNHQKAYSWALEAAQNALEAGLAVAFSVCLNDDLCRREELLNYMDFARRCGVHFVQFLEPLPVGRYKNRPVSLSEASIASVEALYLEMNYGSGYLEYPLIHYLGYYHRRVGCFAGGRQLIHIDADGHLNSCPFCQADYGNLLEGGLSEKLDVMAARGCGRF